MWFLLGLLFIATGLYLGFEFSFSFVYVLVGFFCCVFGAALFTLRLVERPRTLAAAESRKPIHFDSADAIQAVPPENSAAPSTERPAGD